MKVALGALFWGSQFLPYCGSSLLPAQLHARVISGAVALGACAWGLWIGSLHRACHPLVILACVVWIGSLLIAFIRSGIGSEAPTELVLVAGNAVLAGGAVLLVPALREGSGLMLGMLFCSAAAMSIIYLHREVFIVESVADAARYRGIELASPVGMGLVFLVAMSVGLALLGSRSPFAVLLIAVGFYGSTICLQRTNILVAPLAVAVLVPVRIWRNWMLGLALLVVGALTVLPSDPFWQYMAGMWTGRSIEGRLELWGAALTTAWGSPFGGIGLDGWEPGNYPHNFVLQSASDLGLLGGFAALALLLQSCIALVAVRRALSTEMRRLALSGLPIIAACLAAWCSAMKSGDLMRVDVLLPLSIGASAVAWGVTHRHMPRRRSSPAAQGRSVDAASSVSSTAPAIASIPNSPRPSAALASPAD